MEWMLGFEWLSILGRGEVMVNEEALCIDRLCNDTKISQVLALA